MVIVAKALHAIPNIDNSLTKSLDEIISSDIGGVEDVSKQPCQIGDSCVLENNAVRGSLKKKPISHEDPMYSCIPVMGLDVASINSQQRIMVSDKGTSDVGLQGALGYRKSECCHTPQSGSRDHFGFTKLRLTNVEEIDISGHGTGDGMGEELSQDGAAKTLESEPIRGSLDTKVSTSGSEEDANDIKKNDKKIEMPQSDLSRTDVPDMHLEPANMVTSTTAHWVDTTLRLCFEDDGTAQCTFSGAQFVDAGSQSCSNVVSVLHEGSLTDVFSGYDAFEVDGLKDVQSHLAVEELAVKKVKSHSLFESVGEDIINTTPVMVGGRNQNNSMDIDAVEGAKVDIDAAEEQVWY
ncbi:hypothetical protein NC651_004694 [Populus alba x Populus x berolinensis]|nr:hypothetical protein NC651_004694 [Populus alba x Populus x berolinensis]